MGPEALASAVMDARLRWQALTCYCMSLTLSGKTARAAAPREITLSQGGEKREKRERRTINVVH